MKKWLFLIAFVSSLKVVSHADIVKSSNEEPFSLRYSTTGISASTSTILVDLSNTTNFPHKNTGGINLVALRLAISKVAASSGTVQIGVLYRVNASTGDVQWIYSYDLSKSAAGTEIVDQLELNGFFKRLRVDGNGNFPYFIGNDSSIGSTTFQTDVPLLTPYGTYVSPSRGDIVMSFTASGVNPVNITVDLLYNSER